MSEIETKVRDEIKYLSNNCMLDLKDLGFDIDIVDLKGANDSVFVKIHKKGWFLKFGASNKLLENCLFPLLEILKRKYEITFHFTESNISSSLESVDIDFLLSGEFDFSVYEIYIRCKIL